MDGWLKAAVDQAAKLGEEVQKQATLLAEDTGRQELSFRQGDLGFELIGTTVSSVDPDGQAQQMGVRVGDRIVSIAGYKIPPNPSDEQVQRWLEEMIRPGRIIFVSEGSVASRAGDTSSAVAFPTESDAATGDAFFQSEPPSAFVVGDDLDEELSAAVRELREPMDFDAIGRETDCGKLRAQLFAAREQLQSLGRELEEHRAELLDLRHLAAEKADDSVSSAQAKVDVRVQRLQEQLQAARGEADMARRGEREARAELDVATEKIKALQLASVQSEDRALEALEGKEHVLEEEVERLRASLNSTKAEHQTSLRNAVQELRESQERVEDLERKLVQKSQACRDLERTAASTESRLEAAGQELRKAHDFHAAELTSLRSSHAKSLQELRDELRTAQAAIARGESADTKPAGASQSEPSSGASAVEGADEASDDDAVWEPATPSQEVSDSAAPAGEGQEAAALQERLAFLEGRCAALQKKLNSRPIVFRQPKAKAGPSSSRSRARPSWEPMLKNVVGPRSAELAVVLLRACEQGMRSATEQLLQRDAWLWIFYAHLLVLYAIAASCYTQTGGVSGSTLDVDLHSKPALRGDANVAIPR